MSTSPSNPDITLALALQTMQDRRDAAAHRALAREVRVARRQERRTARREARQLGATPRVHAVEPWWMFRFPRPAH